jgi:TPR repeat protein
MYGKYVAKDFAEGRRYMKLAAEQGHEKALEYL